jgi:hypothetical protein
MRRPNRHKFGMAAESLCGPGHPRARQMDRGLAQPAPKSRGGVRRACVGIKGLLGCSARPGAAIDPIK